MNNKKDAQRGLGWSLDGGKCICFTWQSATKIHCYLKRKAEVPTKYTLWTNRTLPSKLISKLYSQPPIALGAKPPEKWPNGMDAGNFAGTSDKGCWGVASLCLPSPVCLSHQVSLQVTLRTGIPNPGSPPKRCCIPSPSTPWLGSGSMRQWQTITHL